MDINQRIAQFETMVRPEADPNNDMAWFSLAGAYVQAGRHADAANAYLRCVELNPAMSKAYQLAGKALIDTGELSRAAEVLKKGYQTAAERGDYMPQKGMGELLQKIGEPIPEIKAQSTGPTPDGSFIDRRTGRPGTRMPRPPFRGNLGQWIQNNISQETFNAWIAQGTKVINEMRLDLSREEDSETYDKQMREYLGIDEELYKSIQQGQA